jgi:hypothetical protein
MGVQYIIAFSCMSALDMQYNFGMNKKFDSIWLGDTAIQYNWHVKMLTKVDSFCLLDLNLLYILGVSKQF